MASTAATGGGPIATGSELIRAKKYRKPMGLLLLYYYYYCYYYYYYCYYYYY